MDALETCLDKNDKKKHITSLHVIVKQPSTVYRLRIKLEELDVGAGLRVIRSHDFHYHTPDVLFFQEHHQI